VTAILDDVLATASAALARSPASRRRARRARDEPSNRDPAPTVQRIEIA
jgi:hypothetical protein